MQVVFSRFGEVSPWRCGVHQQEMRYERGSINQVRRAKKKHPQQNCLRIFCWLFFLEHEFYFSISYIGDNPPHWLSDFSRWLLHHQPVWDWPFVQGRNSNLSLESPVSHRTPGTHIHSGFWALFTLSQVPIRLPKAHFLQDGKGKNMGWQRWKHWQLVDWYGDFPMLFIHCPMAKKSNPFWSEAAWWWSTYVWLRRWIYSLKTCSRCMTLVSR